MGGKGELVLLPVEQPSSNVGASSKANLKTLDMNIVMSASYVTPASLNL
jgi:hypothetical protein